MKLLTSTELRLDVEKLATHGARVVLILLLAWAVSRVLKRVARAAVAAVWARVEEARRRERLTTILLLVNSLIKYVIAFLAAIMVLGELGIDTRPVLAAAGIVGLAVGFGAQNLVRDVVSGFFIIMEGQYAVGDFVEINGVFGKVEEVSLRTTKIRDPNGQLRYFFNGAITSANNYTEEHIAYIIAIPLPGSEADLSPLVKSALADFDSEFQVFAQPPSIGPVADLPTYAHVLRVEAWVIPGRQGLVEGKLASRLSVALERAGRALPQGTEVSLCLRYPPLGSAA